MTIISINPAPNRADTYTVRRGRAYIGSLCRRNGQWVAYHDDGAPSAHEPFDTAEDAAKYLTKTRTHFYEGTPA